MIDVELEKTLQDIRDGKFHMLVLQSENKNKPKPKTPNRIQTMWKKIKSLFHKLKN